MRARLLALIFLASRLQSGRGGNRAASPRAVAP